MLRRASSPVSSSSRGETPGSAASDANAAYFGETPKKRMRQSSLPSDRETAISLKTSPTWELPSPSDGNSGSDGGFLPPLSMAVSPADGTIRLPPPSVGSLVNYISIYTRIYV